MSSLILKTAKQFALVGPLIGGAVYFIPMVLLEHGWGHPQASQSALTAAFMACLMFSYLFGLLPAALTGAVLGVKRQKKGQLIWSASASLIGLCTGSLAGLGIDLYNGAGSGSFLPVAAAFLGLPSCISALVCSCIFRPVD